MAALDRRILALAIPALGSLVAEPLYLLVDTAIVARIGETELAALGVAGQVLLTVVGLCVFLAYGTTTVVARAQSTREQAALGVQGLWLGAITGAIVAFGLLVFAEPIASLVGHREASIELAARFLRISALGAGAQLVAIAGQGWLRGEQRLGQALRLVIGAQLINLLATLALVYGAGLGFDGVAAGTTIAQLCFAAATIWLVVRQARASQAALRPDAAVLRSMVRFGGLLFVRSAALLGSYLLLAAFAARISDAAVGAHLIATQLLWLCALTLDALAIAAQVLVSGAAGRGDTAELRAAARRTLLWSSGCGVLLAALLGAIGSDAISVAFGVTPAVTEAAAQLWPWFLAVQVIGGLVFALDGILIGMEEGAALAASTVAGAIAIVLTLAITGGETTASLWLAVTAMFAGRGLVLVVRALRSPQRPLAAPA